MDLEITAPIINTRFSSRILPVFIRHVDGSENYGSHAVIPIKVHFCLNEVFCDFTILKITLEGVAIFKFSTLLSYSAATVGWHMNVSQKRVYSPHYQSFVKKHQDQELEPVQSS